MHTVALLVEAILVLIFIIILSLVIVNVLALGGLFIIDLIIELVQRIKRGVKK